MTCSKSNRRAASTRNLAANINMIHHMPASSHHSLTSSKIDKRAMIQDSSSETSEDTHSLPYVRKVSSTNPTSSQSSQVYSFNFQKPKSPPRRPPSKEIRKAPSVDKKTSTNKSTMEQRDRSLTVMIPRAKYHPAPPSVTNMDSLENERRSLSVCSTSEAKLINYLDASPSTSKVRSYEN